jgi:predicted nucleotidyltransferase
VRLRDADVGQRHELARRVEEILCKDKRVVDVTPIGSRVNGRADQYSDIDFTVHVSTISDRGFAEELPRVLEPAGPLLVEAWALGFLPGTFIRTLYFEDYPLFWHVDVSCHSQVHADGNDIMNRYH